MDGLEGNTVSTFAVKRAGAGLADQVIYSLSNFALTVAVAHYATVRDFGLFSLIFSAFLLVNVINRGLTSETLMIRYSAERVPKRLNDAFRGACSTSMYLGLVLAFAFAVAGAVGAGSFRCLALVFAAASPGLLLQDTLRYCALTCRMPFEALINDASAFVLQLVLSAVLILTGHAGPIAFLASWAAAQYLGAIIASVRLSIQPSTRGARGWALKNGQYSVRYAIDNLATQASQQGTFYVVAATSGLHDVAALRAAQTVFAPAAIFSLGLQSALLPELVRTLQKSTTQMRRLGMRVAVGLAVIGALWAAVAISMPTDFGRRLFGASWAIAGPLVGYLGVAQVAFGVAGGAAMALRALAMPTLTLWARTATLSIAIVAIGIGSITSGALGVAVATAISSPIQAAVWWSFFEAGLKRHRREAEGRRVSETRNRLTATDSFGLG